MTLQKDGFVWNETVVQNLRRDEVHEFVCIATVDDFQDFSKSSPLTVLEVACK